MARKYTDETFLRALARGASTPAGVARLVGCHVSTARRRLASLPSATVSGSAQPIAWTLTRIARRIDEAIAGMAYPDAVAYTRACEARGPRNPLWRVVA